MAGSTDSRLAPRRGFLRGLFALPLIGGGIRLLGDPTAAATPVSVALLEKYRAFLVHELFATRMELTLMKYPWAFHDRGQSLDDSSTWCAEAWWHELPSDPLAEALVTRSPASSRAAVVLSAVGALAG
jgi:hypothetical protein